MVFQLTDAEVMFFGSDRLPIGSVRDDEAGRTHSVLSSPVVVSHRAIQHVTDGTDRRHQPFAHQSIAVMYCSVSTSGITMLNRVAERIGLDGPE